MICPACQKQEAKNEVIDSRRREFFTWRQRRCECGKKYSTYELILPVHAGQTKKGIPDWLSKLTDECIRLYFVYEDRYSAKRKMLAERRTARYR